MTTLDPAALPLPTPEHVHLGVATFAAQGQVTERAIQNLLRAFPGNTVTADVLLKVVVINQIYSTGILAVQPVAERIQAADIDAALQAGDPDVVHRMDRLQFVTAAGKVIDRSIYSFATKYCAHHQPQHYPIYDGWVSVVQKDWVLARRGTTTIRLHYPSGPTYNPDSDAALRDAWNTLVAPRYRDLQDYRQAFDTLNFERPYLASGTATSLETGARVYVALFRQAESGWIEIVTPDRDTFLKTYRLDPAQFYGVDDTLLRPLRNLRGLNRFAVAASDLTGTWSSNASGYTQWVNAFTGLSAGATGFSSNETFEFVGNGTYRWSIALASGVIGAQTFSSAKSNGKHDMKGNWQISFSDIEGKPSVYNAYFEAGRGGQRILWMQSVGSYSAYVKVK